MNRKVNKRRKPKSRLAHLIPLMVESFSENFDEQFARIPLINDAVQKYRQNLKDKPKNAKKSSGNSSSSLKDSSPKIKVKRVSTSHNEVSTKVPSKTKVRRFNTSSAADSTSEGTSKTSDVEFSSITKTPTSSNLHDDCEFHIEEEAVDNGDVDVDNESFSSIDDNGYIPAFPESSKEHSGNSNTYKVEVPVSDAITYELELRKGKMLMTMDNNFSRVVFPDYDMQKKCLKDSRYIVVKCRSILYSEENESDFMWVYSCCCNAFNASIIDSLDATNGYTNSDLDLSFNLCLHIKSSKVIIEEMSCLSAADAEPSPAYRIFQIDEITQLTFDQSKLVVSCEGSVGVIGKKAIQFRCLCCSLLFCPHVIFFKEQKEIDKDNEVLKLFLDDMSEEALTQPSREYQSISTDKIMFTANTRGQFCLKNSVFDYLQKSQRFESMLVCEDIVKTTCIECGGILEKDSYEVLNLLTLNNIVTCEVYQKRCDDCFQIHPYDGGNDLILNMGKVLIHHSVLRDYMFHFLHGNSCTLTSYYQTWQLTQANAGNFSFKTNINSSLWRHSWYSFLKLLDFDLLNSTSCPKCGDVPEVVVCDATSLGFQRKFATVALQESDANAVVYPRYSDHEDRVAIPSRPLREQFHLFVNNRLNGKARTDFLSKLKYFSKPMYHVVQWVYDVYNPESVPKPLINFFRCLSSSSPVCSYIFPSAYVCDLVLRLCDVGIKGNVEVLRALQNDVPILFNVLSCLTIENSLPEAFKGLLIYLCDLAQAPFKKAVEVRTRCFSSESNCEYARFPNFPKLRDRGYFHQDKASFKNPCRKSYIGHPRLLPGIFTVYCTHGVCFGYQVMESQESPNIPFTIFRTRFPKGCSSRYNISIYPQMKDINSKINEKQNASTKKL